MPGSQQQLYVLVASLRACAKTKDLYAGIKLHVNILKLGLLETISEAVVNMYAKCGALAQAQQSLNGLFTANVFSWTALIAGYVQQGRAQDALICFDRMQHEGLSPDALIFSSILKACGSIGALEKGEEVHDEIARQGLLETDIVLGNTLVDMYAKCGALVKARQVLETLPARDIVTWNAMIAGYAQSGQVEEALKCYERMRFEGLLPNVISWNALITGYTQLGQAGDALNLFECMKQNGVPPDGITFTCILKACGSIKAVDKGEQIHDEIARQMLLENNIVLGTALVDMYVKCGAIVKAEKLLEELPARDVVSWNALIAGYAQNSQVEEAVICLERLQGEGLSSNAASWNAIIAGYAVKGQYQNALWYFEEMQQKGISPDAVTLACILKICGSLGEADKGKQIYVRFAYARQFLPEDSIMLGTALVDMHVKCGALIEAQRVLEELPARDVISWTALIVGYGQQGKGQEALTCFERMQKEGHSPNMLTLTSILKACGSIGASDKGEQIHDGIVRQGLLRDNVELGTSLVDMYAKCGKFGKAREVIDGLLVHDISCWNALIAGYVQHGKGEDALACYEQMKCDGLLPDAVTFACILKAFGSMGAVDKGAKIHEEIVRQGSLDSNIVLGNTLVDMYAQSGMLARAAEVLKELPARDVISWNVLITGYVQHDEGEEAWNCFERMQHDDLLLPDAVTFACILKACGSIGAADRGELIHYQVIREDLLGDNVMLGSALVDMYCKCGLVTKAHRVLAELSIQDAVLWGVLIAGYAQQGIDADALSCFEQMQRVGLSPHGGVFSSILNACSHSGLVDDGHVYFTCMSTRYGISPSKEHYNCMIDLFARAGCLDKAAAVLQDMPSSDLGELWHAVLAACQKQGDVHLARRAFECAVQVDEGDAAAHVLMANVYATAALQEDVYATAALQEDAEHVGTMRLEKV